VSSAIDLYDETQQSPAQARRVEIAAAVLDHASKMHVATEYLSACRCVSNCFELFRIVLNPNSRGGPAMV
jgi:hypothetical protein